MSDRLKILVVDDETAVTMMMGYLLHRVGCEMEAAWNGEQALRLAQAGNFDLITLDITLPGMDGFEICRRLKSDPRLRHTPIVFVSGRIYEDDRQRAFDLGAVDYIVKPFEATDFIFRIISHAKAKERPASASATEAECHEPVACCSMESH